MAGQVGEAQRFGKHAAADDVKIGRRKSFADVIRRRLQATTPDR